MSENPKLAQLREKASRLPLKPGVYIMMDKAGEVIYVGKAKKLKNRVSSYFHGDHLPKVAAMVANVDTFDVIVVESEFEALMLENSLIKRHKPHYNILLKDDKGYPFLRLSDEPYPRFSVVSKTAEDGAEYFGPFGGRSVSFEIIETISKALGLPTCSLKFPQDAGKNRPCLQYHLNNCAGWCRGTPDRADYLARMDQAKLILSGKTRQLTDQLKNQMEQAAEELKFELAAEYRDRLRAIESLSNRQRVIATAFADTDAVGFARGARSCFTVLHFVDGDLAGKDYELMDEPIGTDEEVLPGLVMQYYLRRGTWPKTVLLPAAAGETEDLSRALTESAGQKVRAEIPQRGERLRQVEKARLNAQEEILRATSAQQRLSKTLEWLQKALALDTPPRRIEAFDVSNLGDTGIVAAMTVFKEGKPCKKDYRKFRIRDTATQDDYASMEEAVYRRFLHAKEGDGKFAELPDLLLIDGGENHVRAARTALDRLGMSVPVFGMVKDDRHRTRELVSADGQERGISGNPAVFALIGTIQEETHRFAITYQRSLRSESLKSELDDIPGVGEKSRNKLLDTFKNLDTIKTADYDELCRVVPKNIARAVYDHYHTEEEQQPCE
ncbi:MAG: excinuclease ABC subunit UvrC [Oscillospiraceae bacterium]|nr:excinuclease ABC subunit UvrC [Oscillospiraceae bacterium]